MNVIDLTAYRQALKAEEMIAVDMPDEDFEHYAIDGEIDWLETARVGLYPPLYCVKPPSRGAMSSRGAK